jgi:hypothetical protein
MFSMDLIQGGRTFGIQWSHYAWILAMARSNGWKSAGTTFDVGYYRSQLLGEGMHFDEVQECIEEQLEEWDDNYVTNDHQLVSDSDAAALGRALEAGLDDVPEEDVLMGRRPECLLMPDGSWHVTIGWSEGLSGKAKRIVQKVIAMCRRGGFAIG